VKPKLLSIIGAALLPLAITGMLDALPAAPALATNQNYECSKCASVNGSENYVRNSLAVNRSGTGVCAALWWYSGGWNEEYTCTPKPTEQTESLLCDAAGELYGHGQARRYYAKYEYSLKGNENNYFIEGCD
jgi:hypothetical protein